MAMAGIGIERHVAEHADLGHLFLDRSDRPANEVLGIERLAAVLVAQSWIGVGKDGKARDRELRGALGLAHCLIDRKPLDTRHGWHRGAHPRSVDQEERPDQIVGGQYVLAHEPASPFRLAVAARSYGKVEAGFGFGRSPGFDRRKAPAGFDRSTVFDGHTLTCVVARPVRLKHHP